MAKTSKSKKQKGSDSVTGSTSLAKGGELDNTKSDDDEDDKDMEKEFAKWQSKVGMDSNTINESLNPLERYGLHVKEYIERCCIECLLDEKLASHFQIV